MIGSGNANGWHNLSHGPLRQLGITFCAPPHKAHLIYSARPCWALHNILSGIAWLLFCYTTHKYGGLLELSPQTEWGSGKRAVIPAPFYGKKRAVDNSATVLSRDDAQRLWNCPWHETTTNTILRLFAPWHSFFVSFVRSTFDTRAMWSIPVYSTPKGIMV